LLLFSLYNYRIWCLVGRVKEHVCMRVYVCVCKVHLFTDLKDGTIAYLRFFVVARSPYNFAIVFPSSKCCLLVSTWPRWMFRYILNFSDRALLLCQDRTWENLAIQAVWNVPLLYHCLILPCRSCSFWFHCTCQRLNIIITISIYLKFSSSKIRFSPSTLKDKISRVFNFAILRFLV